MIYKRKRKSSQTENNASSSVSASRDCPSYLYLKRQKLEWKVQHHQEDCELESISRAYCKSAKNEAVVAKSEYGFSSKQTYEAHLKMLLAKNDLITIADVENSYKSFQKARSALDKANKRVNVAASINIFDENGNINRDSTIITPTTNVNEEKDYFLIEEDEDGLVVLGNQFLLSKFFEAENVCGDGTFKIDPAGFTQVYILWYFVEDNESDVPQSRAIAAAYGSMAAWHRCQFPL